MNEFEQVAAKHTIVQFLKDPVIAKAFADMKEKYIADWMKATTVEQREKAHAKVVTIEDLKTQFQVVVDAGTIAERIIEANDKKIPTPGPDRTRR